MGYRPNIVARSLKTQRTKTIGILVPDISSQFYPEIVRGAEDVANIYDYNVILCNSDFDVEKEKEYLRVLKEKMVDGVIYMSSSLSEEMLDLINELDLKTILVETKDKDGVLEKEYLRVLKEKMVDGVIYMSSSLSEEMLDLINELDLKSILVETKDKDGVLPSVTIDNISASYEGTKYLLDKGLSKPAFIGVKQDTMNAWGDRFVGFEKALGEVGINVDGELVYFDNLKVKTGYEAVEKFIGSNKKFDSIVCASDEIAMGAINRLREC